MGLKLTFHGAAACVTGFGARLETGRATVLVDCGMFQGSKTLKALNYDDFPFDPDSIDVVLLTHAHIDHSGLLPKLMRAGYSGPIYVTAGTRDLCAVMLPDAGDIQEGEVRHLNRRNQRRGRPRGRADLHGEGRGAHSSLVPQGETRRGGRGGPGGDSDLLGGRAHSGLRFHSAQRRQRGRPDHASVLR